MTVCKQSLKALLVAFVLQLVLWILLANFLRLPVWECQSALLQLNVQSLVSTVRVFFFTGNFTCNLTFWPELLSFSIHDCISVWYFTLQRDCVHKSFDLSIKVSENFRKHLRALKTIIITIFSCNTICFWN